MIEASHDLLGEYRLFCEDADDLLFTENESNAERLWGVPNRTPFVKDAFHNFVVHGRKEAVNPARTGTKAAAHYRLTLAAGETRVVRLRLQRINQNENSATGVC